MSSSFNPANLVEKLTSAGVSPDQAQAYVDVLRDALLGGLASRTDVQTLAQETDGLRGDLAELRGKMDGLGDGLRGDLEGVRQDLDAKLETLALRLMKPKASLGTRIAFWILGLLAVGGAFAAVFVAGALAPEDWIAWIEEVTGY